MLAPRPRSCLCSVEFNTSDFETVEYHLLSSQGKVIKQETFNSNELEKPRIEIKLPNNLEVGTYVIVARFNNEFFVSKKIIRIGE